MVRLGRASRPPLPPTGVPETEARTFGFQDVAAMREAVEGGSGEPFAAGREGTTKPRGGPTRRDSAPTREKRHSRGKVADPGSRFLGRGRPGRRKQPAHESLISSVIAAEVPFAGLSFAARAQRCFRSATAGLPHHPADFCDAPGYGRKIAGGDPIGRDQVTAGPHAASARLEPCRQHLGRHLADARRQEPRGGRWAEDLPDEISPPRRGSSAAGGGPHGQRPCGDRKRRAPRRRAIRG
jgi:hypothetical protein